MADLFENPMGLMGFDFVEFTAPEPGILEPVLTMSGFTKVATHRSKDVDLWRQGEINIITNYEPNTPSAYYATEHGAANVRGGRWPRVDTLPPTQPNASA